MMAPQIPNPPDGGSAGPHESDGRRSDRRGPRVGGGRGRRWTFGAPVAVSREDIADVIGKRVALIEYLAQLIADRSANPEPRAIAIAYGADILSRFVSDAYSARAVADLAYRPASDVADLRPLAVAVPEPDANVAAALAEFERTAASLAIDPAAALTAAPPIVGAAPFSDPVTSPVSSSRQTPRRRRVSMAPQLPEALK
jgi:hypothetical protein